eukprot:GHVS01087957.1.p1 GENE.GHVS01087957.1~~GHVS01087957.1.p1  ORF type:complete len:265 (-),score=50.29 GHVS01087957.1:928-1722(-)
MGDPSEVDPPKLDYGSALVPQVYRLSPSQYYALIHSPHLTPGVLRLFPHNWMEAFTKTYWWVVPVLWLPVAAALLLYSSTTYSISLPLSILGWCIGLVIWTLCEYLLHRFIFHKAEETLPHSGPIIVLHFLAHAIHHLLPLDPLRLVMPPLLFVTLCTPFWLATSALFPYGSLLFGLRGWCCRGLLLAGWGGAVCGYVMYDMIHYSTHHRTWLQGFSYVKHMQRYHMRHHFKQPRMGFGVSSKLWDIVFGTLLLDQQKVERKEQ